MKTPIACAFAFLLAVSLSIGADVTFNLKDFLGSVSKLQSKTLVVEPKTTPRANSTNLVVSEIQYLSTGTSAVCVASNVNEGVYRCWIIGDTARTTFRINVPDTNGSLTASSLLISQSDLAIDTEDGISIDLE